MWKVASADKHLILYCACTKFITQFTSKINCHGLSWRSVRGNKKIAITLICYARLTQCSKPVRDRKNPFFKIHSSRFLTDLNGCQLLVGYSDHCWDNKKEVTGCYVEITPLPPAAEGGARLFLVLMSKAVIFHITGFYMTSLKFKLKNYQSYWFFSFMRH